MSQSHQPTRRSVAKGAAWTVPLVAVAAPAPAFAASPCSPCPSISAFQGTWGAATTAPSGATWSNNSNKTGFASPNPLTGTSGTFFGTGQEPTTAPQSVSTTLSMRFSASCTYVLNSTLSTWEGSQVAATLRVTIGGSNIGTYTTTTGTGAGALSKKDAPYSSSSFSVSSDGNYPLVVSVSFAGVPSTGQNAGDIWVGSPTMTCSPR